MWLQSLGKQMLMAEKGSGSKIKLKEKMRNSMVPSFSEKTTYFSFKKGNKIQNSYRAKFIFRPKLSETDQNAGNTPKLTEILFELVIVASIKKNKIKKNDLDVIEKGEKKGLTT